MWWAVGAFVFSLVLCRVMLASKSIDRFIASQDAETNSGAEQTEHASDQRARR